MLTWPRLTLVRRLGAFAFACGLASAAGLTDYQQAAQPFFQKNCVGCHNARLHTASLNLEQFHTTADFLASRETFEKVLDKIESGQMPPAGLPRPDPVQLKAVASWISARFKEADQAAAPDPGRITARRLNRSEYNATIRDLLGVDLHIADQFPVDDSGYGFDNNGDVLSLSPILMEKYLGAAEKIARAAIVTDPLPKPALHRYTYNAGLGEIVDGDMRESIQIPVEGDYTFETKVNGLADPGLLVFNVDDRMLGTHVMSVIAAVPRIYLFKCHLTRGEHVFTAHLVATYPPKQGDRQVVLGNKLVDVKSLGGPIKTHLDTIDVSGPIHPIAPPEPESHRRIFVCGHGVGQHHPECARVDIEALARRAFRRPVSKAEVDQLASFVTATERRGGTFEQGMRVALEAILVSPDFLFRIERDPASAVPGTIHPVSDYELASRLSYFLWSSMPDQELFKLAGEGTLHQREVLEAQVRRMLADPKSNLLIENFAGQWLQIRNLDTMKPDPDLFPEFNDELRDAMKTETLRFFGSIMHDDSSILNLIDSRYTFLNGRLARFYGIGGVYGPQFRRVELGTNQERGGVLTDASVLMVTSYPNRTSPVLRGKWLLENILNAPPPPPPPNVPNLKTEGIGATVSLRQQLEEHRANAVCASCHSRIDPLGFGLENYNAIGGWRTHDGKIPIDSSGKMPDGVAFNGSAGLKHYLLDHQDVFVRSFVEAMMTYGLGRGLESSDRPLIQAICRETAAKDNRFSAVILGIVESVPFQLRRSAIRPAAGSAPARVASGGQGSNR